MYRTNNLLLSYNLLICSFILLCFLLLPDSLWIIICNGLLSFLPHSVEQIKYLCSSSDYKLTVLSLISFSPFIDEAVAERLSNNRFFRVKYFAVVLGNHFAGFSREAIQLTGVCLVSPSGSLPS